MLIEEIVRTCVNESVAQAAVASIGRRFAGDVAAAATVSGMTVGGFTAYSVDRFARQGDEGQLRSVVAAMNNAQEPLLAGLHHILCATLTGVMTGRRRAGDANDVEHTS